MRAGGIISRLRKLVRSDGQDDRLPTDINSIIEELKVLLSADARVYDTRLNIALTAGLPKVSANPAQLQQLILNLARNAFEAMIDMPSGKRQIELSTVRNESGDVEIRVSDTGPGISPEILRSAVLSIRDHEEIRHRPGTSHQPYHRARAWRYYRHSAGHAPWRQFPCESAGHGG